jgi:hypothetical protein
MAKKACPNRVASETVEYAAALCAYQPANSIFRLFLRMGKNIMSAGAAARCAGRGVSQW